MSTTEVRNTFYMVVIILFFLAGVSIFFHYTKPEAAEIIDEPEITIEDKGCLLMTVTLIIHDERKVMKSKRGCRCLIEMDGQPYLQLQSTPERCQQPNNTKSEEPEEEDIEI